MKLINSKSFTATNTVRSAATITVLVLCLSAARGENLTTLDGKTYLNITEITKYPKQIYFTCDSNRVGLAITNLPEEFRTKHEIIIKTNAPTPTISVSQTPVDPTNLFLWQNRETDLYQLECSYFTTNDMFQKESKQFCIDLTKGTEVSLTANTEIKIGDYEPRKDSQMMEFEVGQEQLVSNIFEKFIDWDSVARTNHAENFEKEFARRPMNQSASDYAKEIYKGFCVYTFSWNNGEATLRVEDTAPYSGNFQKEDVIHFQALLKLLPSMKEKLVAAIKGKEVQKDLFK